MQNNMKQIVTEEFFKTNNLSTEGNAKLYRIKKKEYFLSTLFTAYLKKQYPDQEISWRFSSLFDDKERGIDIQVSIGKSIDIPVDLTTNNEKKLETK